MLYRGCAILADGEEVCEGAAGPQLVFVRNSNTQKMHECVCLPHGEISQHTIILQHRYFCFIGLLQSIFSKCGPS